MATAAEAATRARPVLGPWEHALRARATFEAEAKGKHTRAEYARVMEAFRAIYHNDPADAHAARAVAQVAELLAEQGRELKDAKSLREAAGQWEFLAKAYPSPAGSPMALGQALDLLGPQGVGDAAEARRVRTTLLTGYPKSSAARAARESASLPQAARESAELPAALPARRPATAVATPAVRVNDVPAGPAKPVTVTGIRHWSTASYTRVAIDLSVEGDAEVTYRAVRVENPDRIFFDVQHARLAAPLEGKTFTVADEGFLTRVRAAPVGDSTRVVLDVRQAGTYSAFVLPNPYRLIVDIHGKAGARDTSVAAVAPAAPAATVPAAPVAAPRSPGGAQVSSLPPMPVTDGSAAFGLPARDATGRPDVPPRADVPPRVVISSAATPARPVPNSVATSNSDARGDVAAVGAQAGRVDATRRPTSLPVTSPAASGDHYVSPRARAAATHDDASVSNEPPKHPGTEAATPETAAGATTLMRALGLKIGRIVIDAGHGGHDSGTLGAGGIEEKDVVLDVALRLGRLLHERLGAEIVYTRADDTFIPLETRTAIANKAQADLFISVHANSSQDASARGVEVYYLNFTSDPEAMKVAARENAVSNESVHELSDLVKKIALKEKIDESRELAGDVDASLYAGLRKGNEGLKDRGVKKAPFVVLIGANMPSILAEISFVTNPDDAEQLQTPAYRQRVAESLYAGVAKYAAGVNGAPTLQRRRHPGPSGRRAEVGICGRARGKASATATAKAFNAKGAKEEREGRGEAVLANGALV